MKNLFKTLATGAVLAVLSSASMQIAADDRQVGKPVVKHNSTVGFAKHELASGDRLLGWQVADGWYFGRAKHKVRRMGEQVLETESRYDRDQADSGGSTLALVWQSSAKQNLALSTDGLRLTRRFN